MGLFFTKVNHDLKQLGECYAVRGMLQKPTDDRGKIHICEEGETIGPTLNEVLNNSEDEAVLIDREEEQASGSNTRESHRRRTMEAPRAGAGELEENGHQLGIGGGAWRP